MTYTFKLARRLAVLRSVALVSGMLLGAACAEDTTTAPGDGAPITPTPVPLDNSNQVDPTSSVTTAMTATLRKIYLAPANVSIKTYRTAQYRWYARTMSWDSVPVNVTLTATGGTITPSGLFTAGKVAGTYRVIATLGHFADTSVVVLTAAPPPSWAPRPEPPVQTPTNPAPIPAPVTPVSGPAGDGVPVGPFHLPNDQYGVRSWYNGALRALSPRGAATDLAYAKSKGIRIAVSLPGSRSGYTNSDRTFSMSRWKQSMDAWRSQAAMLQSYYASGTIIANYLVDEPDCSSCWGGKPISGAEVAEMGRYAKSVLPGVPTVVRAVPAWFRRVGLSGNYIDVAWAQYTGPLHSPSLRMSPEQFRDQSVADAKALGMGLILGMNTLDGGDGSSRIPGTYDLRYVSSRWQMSASEVERAGTVFASEPYACAVLDWRFSPTLTSSSYSPSQAAGIRAFDDRSDVKAAFAKVLAAAKRRAANRCK
jgi:hypothetical protein